MKAQLIYNRQGEVRVLLHNFDEEERRLMDQCTDLRGVVRSHTLDGQEVGAEEEGQIEAISFEPVRYVQVQ